MFGNVRGVVHDPQHRPVGGARVVLKATASDFSLSAETNADGLFEFPAIQLGGYTVSVESAGFATQAQELMLASGCAPVLHYQLAIATAEEKVTVTAPPADLDPQSPQRTCSSTKSRFRTTQEWMPAIALNHYGVRPQLVHGARPTARSRWTPGDLGAGWRADSEHKHRFQCRPTVQSERCAVSAGGKRKLLGGVWRPHLWRF